MNHMKAYSPEGASGRNSVRLSHHAVCVALLLFSSFMVCGGASEMSESQPVKQPEVTAEFLEMLAKWQAVRTPGQEHSHGRACQRYQDGQEN